MYELQFHGALLDLERKAEIARRKTAATLEQDAIKEQIIIDRNNEQYTEAV